MRPAAALLAILTGSTVAMAVGLLLTWVVTLFLSADAARFAPEQGPLLKAVTLFTLFAAASSASFYGAMRWTKWRFQAYLATILMFGATLWMYWPRK